MGTFDVDFHNIPDHAVIADGGLKFRVDERALREYFDPILSHVSLNDLIGEAVFYIRVPATLFALALAVLLSVTTVWVAVAVSISVALVAYVAVRFVYFRTLNYLVVWLGNPVIHGVLFAALVALAWSRGDFRVALVFGGALLLLYSGLLELLDLPLDLAFRGRRWTLALSDEVLRAVGWRYGLRLGLNPLTWKMTISKDTPPTESPR